MEDFAESLVSHFEGADIVPHYFSEVTSTNDVARLSHYRHGDLVVADVQSKGRGQRGNRWESLTGENLTFSIVLHPAFLPADRQFLLSEAVSLGITDALDSYGLPAKIKWPNDIYISNRKICGILIENDIMGVSLSRSIIGIGLNVNQTVFPDDIPNPTSFKLELGQESKRWDVLSSVCNNIMGRYHSLKAGNSEVIEHDYHSRLYLQGVTHIFKFPNGSRREGTIESVYPVGVLKVRFTDDSTGHYLFKEISF